MNGKRLSVVIVVILMIANLLGACSSSKKAEQPKDSASSNTTAASKELGYVDNIKITAFNWGWDNPVLEQDIVLPELTKRVGLKQLVYDSIKVGSYDETLKKMQLWASTGAVDWPHFLASGADNQSKLIINSLGEAGKVKDLTPWLEKWPNVKKAVEPLLPLMKNPHDGKLYYMPQNFSMLDASLVDQVPVWIRKDWLDKLQLPYPKTIDEFYNTLKQFKEKIKEVNGQPIVPYMAFGENFENMLPLFFPDGQYMWYTDSSGNAAYGPITTPQNLIRGLKFYYKFYKEGLIDKEAFSLKQGQIDERGNQGRIGAMHGAYWEWATPYNDVMQKTNQNAMFVGIPLYDPQVDSEAHKMKYKLEAYSLWSIKNDIPDEEINTFFKVLDYVLSEEGTILVKFGIEGKQWVRNADGKITASKDFMDRTQGDYNKGVHEGVDVYGFIPNWKAVLKNGAPSPAENREDLKITWKNLGYKYAVALDTELQAYVTADKIENKKWLGISDRYKQMVVTAVTAPNESDIDGIVTSWVNGEKARGYAEIVKERTQAAKSIDLSTIK